MNVAEAAEQCVGNRGLYVVNPVLRCRRMTRQRVNGLPLCRDHAWQANRPELLTNSQSRVDAGGVRESR